MQCPACDATLTHQTLGTVQVDVCERGCVGIWFDRAELRQVDQANEGGGEALLALERRPDVRKSPERRRCPRCEARYPLLARRVGPKVDVTVDECPGCGGHWLDGGELDKIRALSPLAPVRAPENPEVLAILAAERVRNDNEREYSLLGLLRWLHG